MNRWYVVLLLMIISCSTDIGTEYDKGTVVINSRDEGDPQQRQPLYWIEIPRKWSIETSDQSVADTKLPLITFIYKAEGKKARITVHNFPYETTEQRIPAEAQIARWKGQFSRLESSSLSPQAFGGYVGYLLEAEGTLDDSPTGVIAWAMALAPIHERSLSSTHSYISKQMSSDVTIKATGDRSLIDELREEIKSIGRSFELINALPNP